MVAMRIVAYERKQFESEILIKLKEALVEAESTDLRYTHVKVL